ncbi:hypothetical protein GINT2_001454 [Glugoides intestinalis]
MLTQNLIFNWTSRMNFPLKVKSTALQLNTKLQSYFKTNSKMKELDHFSAKCFKSQACIFLACKIEDIHGYLDKIMQRIEEFSQKRFLDYIVEIEPDLIEFLQFDFDFVNLYQSALTVKFLAEAKKPENRIQWGNTVTNLNKALCGVDLNGNLIEVVLSAFEPNNITDLGLVFDKELVNKIRRETRPIMFLSEQEIEKAEKSTDLL